MRARRISPYRRKIIYLSLLVAIIGFSLYTASAILQAQVENQLKTVGTVTINP
ncbi:MAG: hypothetical protein ACTSW4_04335 [Candidatus Ranarchaeia archaeon]